MREREEKRENKQRENGENKGEAIFEEKNV